MPTADRVVDRRFLIGLLAVQALALLLRGALQLQLGERGVDDRPAMDLSYLVVPLIMALYLTPNWRGHAAFLRGQFALRALTLRLVLIAVAVGFLLRLAAWGSFLAVGAVRAFAAHADANTNADAVAAVYRYGFSCPPPVTLVVYVAVMAVIVPLVEEAVNRGFLLQRLLPWSRPGAMFLSSLAFAVFHAPAAMTHAFVTGLLLALLALRSASLWPPTIAHASFNGLIAVDWLCLQQTWLPSPNGAAAALGIGGALAWLAALLAAAGLSFRATPEPGAAPVSPHA